MGLNLRLDAVGAVDVLIDFSLYPQIRPFFMSYFDESIFVGKTAFILKGGFISTRVRLNEAVIWGWVW